jgi:hypothetical protein
VVKTFRRGQNFQTRSKLSDEVETFRRGQNFQVSEVDCVAFGFLVISKYAPISADVSLDNYPNFSRYVDRMKSEVYPDWDEMLKVKI